MLIPERPDRFTPTPGTVPVVVKKNPHIWRKILLTLGFAGVVLLAVAGQSTVSPTSPTSEYVGPHMALEQTLDANPASVSQFCDGYYKLKGLGFTDDQILAVLESRSVFSNFREAGLSDGDVYDAITARCVA